ncbi:MAG: hypothetical protein JST54_19100 [Deltaproteobacteria bacterium]|nr:hypothetical protein [Deltaproteobacteria bacterium]
MGAKHWLVAAAASGALLAGCEKPPPQEELDELAQVKRDRAQLDADFDELGARLLEDRSIVTTDAVLEARHQQVSQVACQNLSDHWTGINRFLDNQTEKEKDKHRSRVASYRAQRD